MIYLYFINNHQSFSYSIDNYYIRELQANIFISYYLNMARNKKAKFNLRQVLKDKKVNKAGLSAYSLSKKLDVPTSRMTVIMKPGYNPTLETLNKIANALSCSVCDLIEE